MGNLYDRAFNQYDMVTLRATEHYPEHSVLGTILPSDDENVIQIKPWADQQGVLRLGSTELVGQTRRVGVVRDFLKFKPQIAGKDLWPWIFNVADAYLVVGVAVLLLSFGVMAKAQSGQGKTSGCSGAE